MENYLWILILVLAVAPFVLLLWAIRSYRRWRNRRGEEARKRAERDRAILAGEIKTTPEEIAAAERSSSGFSFPLGVPIVVIVLFIVLLPSGSKHWWGWLVHGVYVALTGLFFYEACSRKSYEKIHAQYPTLNRATWVLNWLIFFAIPMLLVWLFLGLPAVWRILRG